MPLPSTLSQRPVNLQQTLDGLLATLDKAEIDDYQLIKRDNEFDSLQKRHQRQ